MLSRTRWCSMISYTPEEIEEMRLDSLNSLGGEDEQGVLDPGYVVADHMPGTFSYHEALDRTSVFMELVANHMEHRAILLDPEAHKIACDAQVALFNLYQYLGAKHL
jgi:hypothetical protein